MPTLIETEYTGEIVWLGHVAQGESLRSVPRDSLTLGFDGVAREQHEGLTAPSCVRVRNLHPEGTKIANVRQLSILSQEELDVIAAEMEMETLDPSYLGATMVVRGIPDFTHIPPSSRLQGPDGCTLVADMENRPCIFPGREVEADSPGHGPKFKPAATGRRGITAWVQRPGALKRGDKIRLFVPDQRAWAP
ncbi:sulfurase [Aliisedimentitalea scapharcae]|uniref:Sulfurase n=1 Tax=Aliisedimentitalea scapharcae TaxID=1524259 RepID=A0ABZ2XVF1_9RHOB|nr:MOSC domain-containing protein [Rhodobacteraceae bacterium M382]